MSRNNQIDELFRRSLDEQGMEYRSEYWEQMESLIEQKKGPRKGLWLMAGIIFLALAGTTLGIIQFSPSDTTAIAEASTEQKVARHKNAQNAISPKEVKQKEVISQSTSNNKELAGIQAVQLKSSSQESRSKHTTSIEKKSTEPVNTEEGFNTLPIQPKEESPIIEAEKIQTVELVKEKSTARTNQLFQAIANKSIKTDFGSLLRMNQIIKALGKPLEDKNSDRRLLNKWQWFLGGLVNYGSIKSTNDAETNAWKSQHEKMGSFVQYGLQVRMARRNFSVVVGASMRQWTEYTNYTRSLDHYTFDSSLRMVKREYMQRPDGSYIALLRKEYDTLTHTTSTEVICKDCPVKFQYISIPVAFHYELGKGKWQGFAEAGFNFSFLSKQSGEYGVMWQAEKGTEPSLVTANGDKKYYTSMLVQSNLTLGIKYRINPFISLNTRLNYQGALNSMMKDYRQEYSFYSLGFGAEYLLR